MNSDAQFTATLVTSYSGLRSLASEWTALWERCPGATSFQRPEWLLPWVESFTPEAIYTVAVRHGELLVGLAPMFRYKSGSQNLLVPIGASISDYLDWLVDPRFSQPIVRRILKAFGEAEIPWDRLEMTDLPPGSRLAAAHAFAGRGYQHLPDNACPVLALPPSWEELERRLSAKFRHNLRTAERRLARVGAAAIEIADERNLPEFLAAMLELHGARWKEMGMPGVLAEDTVKSFHLRAAPGLLARGVLRLYGLRLNGRLIATLYALAEEQTVYCYLQAFDPACRQLSPGVQLLAAVIKDAIRMRKREVDFLRGREAYKYLWGAEDRPTYRVNLERQTRVERAERAA